MIPDVPRVPSDSDLRSQMLEAYRTVAILRDNVEYQLGVLEDRLAQLQTKDNEEIESINKSIKKINTTLNELSKATGGLAAQAFSAFAINDWLAGRFESRASGVASSLAVEAESAFSTSSLGFTFDTEASGVLNEE